MTITEFLLARIAEDEMAAETQREMGRLSAKTLSRALAECEAKRRIVEVHQQSSQEVWLDIPDSAWSPEEWSSFRPDYYERDACLCCADLALMANETREWPCRTLCALAAVYADHPDFDPEWAL